MPYSTYSWAPPQEHVKYDTESLHDIDAGPPKRLQSGPPLWKRANSAAFLCDRRLYCVLRAPGCALEHVKYEALEASKKGLFSATKFGGRVVPGRLVREWRFRHPASARGVHQPLSNNTNCTGVATPTARKCVRGPKKLIKKTAEGAWGSKSALGRSIWLAQGGESAVGGR